MAWKDGAEVAIKAINIARTKPKVGERVSISELRELNQGLSARA